MITIIFDNDIKHSENIKEAVVQFFPENNPPFFNVTMAEFCELSESTEPIVVFIDTKFRTTNGNFLQFARKIRELNETCHICFMSHYSSDIAYCYKKLVRPSGFLLKPVEADELRQLCLEIVTYEHYRRSNSEESEFILKSKGETRIVHISEVVYFTAVDKKIFCYTASGEELSFYDTLSKIEKAYGRFLLRCHNGFLVNRNKIDGFSKNNMMLLVRGANQGIPVSKSRCKEVESFIKTKMMEQIG